MQIAKQSIQTIIIAAMLLLSTMFVTSFAVQSAHAAADTAQACAGLGWTGGNCGTGGETNIRGVIVAIINILSTIVGAVAVIMIIIAGVRYVTSSGDSGSVAGAKNTIIYAIVGLIIVILAQAIVGFVLNRITTT